MIIVLSGMTTDAFMICYIVLCHVFFFYFHQFLPPANAAWYCASVYLSLTVCVCGLFEL